MIKILSRIYTLMFGLLLFSCTETSIVLPDDSNADGDKITVAASFVIPEMSEVVSRSLGDTPDYSALKLYVLEFDKVSDDPLDNFISNTYEASVTTVRNGKVEFSITLDKASTSKVLHFVAVPRQVRLAFGTGSEASLMPYLWIGDNQEAYWARMEFPNGYGTLSSSGEWTTSQAFIDRIANIPMIRNFARISVAVDSSCSNYFSLLGFAVVNTPREGSVAPWDQSLMRFPELLNTDYTQKNYDEINYSGFLANFNIKTELIENDLTTASKFIYERQFSKVNPTRIILKGIYNGAVGYYKIDIGQLDANTGMFNFMNIIRNYHYKITVTDVVAAGALTLTDALEGPVSNNLSFDMATEKMTNIAIGSAIMWVNFTTAVVTQSDNNSRTLRFAYRFRNNLSSSDADNKVDIYGLAAGDVIETVDYNKIAPPADSLDWKFIEIKTKKTTAIDQRQQFILVNKATGLARTVTLILRSPWEIRNQKIYAGTYTLPNEFPYTDNTYLGKVGSGEKAPLTLFFRIPENLPQAIFPLSFVIECNPQIIENNPIDNMTVQGGSSLWGTEYGCRIQYVRRITWTDYNTDLDAAHPTGVRVDDYYNPGQKVHIAHCRFRTLSTLSSGTQVATVRISNPYFSTARISGTSERENNGIIEASFTRTAGVPLTNVPQ